MAAFSDLANKSVLVTGAATGIGRALSIELGRRGANVFVSALSQEAAETVVAEIHAEGNRAQALTLDVTDNAALAQALQTVRESHGSLDVVINNAGVLYLGEFTEMDERGLEHICRVNLTAVAMGTLLAGQIMREQGRGLIVNVASMGGLLPVGTMAAYSATKHGVVGLSASVGGELAPFGVDVKTVCPGNIASDMLKNAQMQGYSPERVLEDLPKLVSAEQAAVYFVDRFTRQQRLIVFPRYARLMAFMQRLWPGFGHRGVLHSMQQFRSRRDQSSRDGKF